MTSPVDFLRQPEFQAGLVGGVAGAGACWGASIAWPAIRRAAVLPAAGLLFAGAAVVALLLDLGLRDQVIGAVVVLALAGAVRLNLPIRILASAFGAAVLAFDGGLSPKIWIRVTVALVTVAAGWAVTDFDKRWQSRGYGPVLLAITVVGVYYTVPDTNQALVLLGAALPVLFLGWPQPLASLGTAGSMAAVGLLAWTVGFDGFGRQSSIVGGLACLGVLGLEPIAYRLRRDHWTPMALLPSGLWGAPVLGVVHLGLVFLASQVAGTQSPATYRYGRSLARGAVAPAAEIVLVTWLGALALSIVLGLWRQRPHRSP